VRIVALPVLLLAASAWAASYDANGVALGDREAQVKQQFPSIHCQPLQWKSRAADRRCDDSRISFAGAQARITFYLRNDAVEGFDVRFDTKDLDQVTEFLKSRYGAPRADGREKIWRKGKELREMYKARWEQGAERAVLSAQLDKKRGTLSVSRGNFEEEIYRVR
jgi:hypothetical protein